MSLPGLGAKRSTQIQIQTKNTKRVQENRAFLGKHPPLANTVPVPFRPTPTPKSPVAAVDPKRPRPPCHGPGRSVLAFRTQSASCLVHLEVFSVIVRDGAEPVVGSHQDTGN